jgi:hypothetical protein
MILGFYFISLKLPYFDKFIENQITQWFTLFLKKFTIIAEIFLNYGIHDKHGPVIPH